jgi:hypothetical protein
MRLTARPERNYTHVTASPVARASPALVAAVVEDAAADAAVVVSCVVRGLDLER